MEPSMKHALRHVVVCLGVVALTGSCLNRDLKPLTPCIINGFVNSVNQQAVDKVDLLFMVDNSNSMAEEQASLAREFPKLIRVLATGDKDGNGTMDFQPVKDLHVGIISSDLGSLDYGVPTCTTTFGDDGAMRNRGNTALTGMPACLATYPDAFFSFQPGAPGANSDQFIRNVECVAVMGTGGCGFEQQLESALKALTPSTSNLRFLGIPTTGPTLGQGDRANAGFLREDSVLAIILVTDEEDCSVSEGELFRLNGGQFNIDLNIKCSTYPEAQQPISRYVQGFRALREARPELLVVSAIAGVPQALIPPAGMPINYDRILMDPSMQPRIDPASSAPNRMLLPSCNTANGIAFPPVRIVNVVKEFGENGIIQSICAESFGPALDAIIAKIADALGNVCLPRALNPNSEGNVDCDVVEILPSRSAAGVTDEMARCANQAGRGRDAVPVRVEGSREVCKIRQLVPPRDAGGTRSVPTGQGWYYDDFSSDTQMRCPSMQKQRIAFTAGSEPVAGATVRLECLQSVGGTSSTVTTFGSFCSNDIVQAALARRVGGGCATPNVCTLEERNAFCQGSLDYRRTGAAQSDLLCDTASNTCQVPCTTNADCTTSGLRGFLCDRRPKRAGQMPEGICVNPTCDFAN